MPQRSIVRKRQKARRTKQLAEWRQKQEASKASGKTDATKGKKG